MKRSFAPSRSGSVVEALARHADEIDDEIGEDDTDGARVSRAPRSELESGWCQSSLAARKGRGAQAARGGFSGGASAGASAGPLATGASTRCIVDSRTSVNLRVHTVGPGIGACPSTCRSAQLCMLGAEGSPWGRCAARGARSSCSALGQSGQRHGLAASCGPQQQNANHAPRAESEYSPTAPRTITRIAAKDRRRRPRMRWRIADRPVHEGVRSCNAPTRSRARSGVAATLTYGGAEVGGAAAVRERHVRDTARASAFASAVARAPGYAHRRRWGVRPA